MEKLYKKYKEFTKKSEAILFAMRIVFWDAQTEAPKSIASYRSEMLGELTKQVLAINKDPQFIRIVNSLYEKIDFLDDFHKREIYEEKRELDKLLKVPEDLMIKHQKLKVHAQQLWEEAREKQDFSIFESVLKEMIDLVKEITSYTKEENQTIYEALIDDFERGITLKDYDKFFDQLRADLVPFVLEVIAKEPQYNDDFMKLPYDVARQKKFVEYLMEVLPFDTKRGGSNEGVHPFCWGTSPDDVRFTLRYLENNFLFSIFASTHEMGHAMHYQGVDRKYLGTPLFRISSAGFIGLSISGIAESQSRFYENIIARSKAFWEVHYHKLQSIFKEELQDVPMDDFYKVYNKVQQSYIRVVSDELTYPLHIMVRYEIEKALFNDEIEVKDLPKIWNQKMKKYLNITPRNDSEGVLQDVHWSLGWFGYFPTYALGGAYASQWANEINKTINIDECIKESKLDVINDWLKENIHKYGSFKLPKQLLLDVTNEEFNPKYYIEYLKRKYTELLLK